MAVAAWSLLATLPSCSSDDEPTRVLLIGDSVMNQLASGLERQVGGDVEIRDAAVFGSGLLSPWFVDWRRRLDRVLDDYDPDVVLFLFVGNYEHGSGRFQQTSDGEPITSRTSPEFFTAWQQEAERLTEEAADEGDVTWILPPPMQPPEWAAVVQGLRRAYREVAEATGADLIDANAALARPDGSYDGDGGLRSIDGVHLAPAGADALAVEVMEALDL